MSTYGIDVYNFEFWEGPPPSVPTQKTVASHRPGVDGVALQLIGTWADAFEVQVTSHWETQLLAAAGYAGMKTLIGLDPVFVKYNNFNWAGMCGVGYHVMAVEQVSMRSVPRLIGPNYDFIGGCVLVTKWTLSPQQV